MQPTTSSQGYSPQYFVMSFYKEDIPPKINPMGKVLKNVNL